MHTIDVRIANPEDRLPIQRMLELYQHDLSDIWDQDLDCHGEYGYELDHCFGAEGCRAFVATVAGRYAGFALADRAVRIGTEGSWMDQFFVVRKYRRRGVGESLARTVFAALPGRWEVGQMPANHAAQAFWRKVIGAYTSGQFKEHEVRIGRWQGVVQMFDSRKGPAEALGSAGCEAQAMGREPVTRQLISSGSTFEEQIGYSRAVVAGDWVFVSGTTGFDYRTMSISDSLLVQTEQCLQNIDAALRQAGSGLADVVRVTYVLPDGTEFEQCWPVLRKYFGTVRPAATMISAGLADPRIKIEIEVTALKRPPPSAPQP